MYSHDLEELLGRPPRALNMGPALRALRGAAVLVTGAGGSIGSELCHELASVGCKRVVALDHSDHALIEVIARTRRDHPGTDLREVICDVRDAQRLDFCIARARPDVVIHAAALKHVHMGDRHPVESVLTNLVGVRNAVEASARAGVGRFLLVSSDKAAAPGSVMGACKRLAELYLLGCAKDFAGADKRMHVASVRFGNVFGSSGSVAPIFAEQIAAGEPVTVTHKDMRRFFMTMREAIQLILLVCGVEDRDDAAAYLLDMGDEVWIMDLAHRMIARAGADVPIVTTAVREGEKLNEELFDSFERIEPSRIEGVSRIRPTSRDMEITSRDIAELERSVRMASDDSACARVFELLDSRLKPRVLAAG